MSAVCMDNKLVVQSTHARRALSAKRHLREYLSELVHVKQTIKDATHVLVSWRVEFQTVGAVFVCGMACR